MLGDRDGRRRLDDDLGRGVERGDRGERGRRGDRGVERAAELRWGRLDPAFAHPNGGVDRGALQGIEPGLDPLLQDRRVQGQLRLDDGRLQRQADLGDGAFDHGPASPSHHRRIHEWADVRPPLERAERDADVAGRRLDHDLTVAEWIVGRVDGRGRLVVAHARDIDFADADAGQDEAVMGRVIGVERPTGQRHRDGEPEDESEQDARPQPATRRGQRLKDRLGRFVVRGQDPVHRGHAMRIMHHQASLSITGFG